MAVPICTDVRLPSVGGGGRLDWVRRGEVAEARGERTVSLGQKRRLLVRSATGRLLSVTTLLPAIAPEHVRQTAVFWAHMKNHCHGRGEKLLSSPYHLIKKVSFEVLTSWLKKGRLSSWATSRYPLMASP